jgi:hypothetical protein
MNKTYPLFRYVRPILALLIVSASFAFMFLLALHPIPANNSETINLVVGFMLGITATVGAYYFGTSKDKSDGEQQQRSPNTATTVVTKTEEIK